MVDLTKNEEEKENYIIDIDETSYDYSYLVKYANGKEELFYKTEAIREELLMKLEKQFLKMNAEYKSYAKDRKKHNLKESIDSFLFIEIVWLIIDYNISPDILAFLVDYFAVGIFMAIISVALTICTIINEYKLNEKLNKAHIIEIFLKHKEDFEVLLYKFSDGRKIKYSPIDLINIDEFNSLEEICDYVNEIEEQVKLEKLLH